MGYWQEEVHLCSCSSCGNVALTSLQLYARPSTLCPRCNCWGSVNNPLCYIIQSNNVRLVRTTSLYIPHGHIHLVLRPSVRWFARARPRIHVLVAQEELDASRKGCQYKPMGRVYVLPPLPRPSDVWTFAQGHCNPIPRHQCFAIVVRRFTIAGNCTFLLPNTPTSSYTTAQVTSNGRGWAAHLLPI